MTGEEQIVGTEENVVFVKDVEGAEVRFRWSVRLRSASKAN